jgi:hypothetical protein
MQKDSICGNHEPYIIILYYYLWKYESDKHKLFNCSKHYLIDVEKITLYIALVVFYTIAEYIVDCGRVSKIVENFLVENGISHPVLFAVKRDR